MRENESLSEEFETDKQAIFTNPPNTIESFQTQIEPTKPKSPLEILLETLPKDNEIKVIPTRLADKQFAGTFRLPATTDFRVEAVYLNTDLDIEEMYNAIRKENGGGKYRFQLHYNGGFKESWTETISDPNFLSEKEKVNLEIEKSKTKIDENERKETVSQNFVNPAPATIPDTPKPPTLLETLQEQDALDEILYKRFSRREPTPPPTTPTTEKSAFQIAIEATVNNPAIQAKIAESQFIKESKSNWFDGIIALAANKEARDFAKDFFNGTVETVASIFVKPDATPPPTVTTVTGNAPKKKILDNFKTNPQAAPANVENIEIETLPTAELPKVKW